MKIAYDCTLRRPGCVILQAVMGCDAAGRELSMRFDSKLWLVAPTPDLKLYDCTPEQGEQLLAITAAFHK